MTHLHTVVFAGSFWMASLFCFWGAFWWKRAWYVRYLAVGLGVGFLALGILIPMHSW